MSHNVVVIVMDTARWQDVFPPDGGDGEIAPTLTSIARSGVRFDHAFAPAPWTLPSHASLFTGAYPSKHGAHADHKRLRDGLTVLPETLRAAGYETVAVSNNTWISEEFGFGRGFETFYKTWQYVQADTDFGDIAQTEEGLSKIRALVPRLFEGNPLVNLLNAAYGRFGRRRRDSGARRTNEWIDQWLDSRDDARPFFLFVNYLEPHLEYRPPAAFARSFLPADVTYEEAMDVSQDAWAYVAGKSDHGPREFEILRALYRAEIAYLDERLGDVRDALRDAGEWEDTLLIVTSDHGENIGDHDLMDHQYCLYDTVLRVPLVIRGASFGHGTVDSSLVSLVDLAPTILDALDVSAAPMTDQFQGRSLVDEDEPTVDRVFAEYLAPQPSMAALEKRVGPLPDEVRRYDRALRAVRTTDWKLVRGSDGSRECYDLAADPDERADRSDERSDRVAELEGALDEWLDSFDSPSASGGVSMSPETRRRLKELGYLQE